MEKITFIDDLKKLGISLNTTQTKQFEDYFNLLLSENEKINLTAITKRDEVFKKHFVDSLSLIKYGMDLKDNLKIIDLGSGAGFPGIPLKIAFPQLSITLVDSLNKRVDFLEDVINELNLSDINAVHGRAEELARQDVFRENFDFCVSRAVANLSTLAEYCLPFVKVNGFFISYKAEDVSDEVSAAENSISLLGGRFDKEVSFILPNSDISRTLVGVRKISETPEKYPRRTGLPGKRPL